MTTTSVPDLSGRRPPGLGGFNLTALNLEIRRLRRNPRAVIWRCPPALPFDRAC